MLYSVVCKDELGSMVRSVRANYRSIKLRSRLIRSLEDVREDVGAAAAVAAVVRVQAGSYRRREVGRERLVVDDAWREEVRMYGVHQV